MHSNDLANELMKSVHAHTHTINAVYGGLQFVCSADSTGR